MLTAPGHGLRDGSATPPALPQLIATLGRLTRLLRMLEDLAHYGGHAMLSNSWSRISDLLPDAERLAPAGARQLSARPGDLPMARITDHVTPIIQLALAVAVAEHPIGSPRWWFAVHTLGQRGRGFVRVPGDAHGRARAGRAATASARLAQRTTSRGRWCPCSRGRPTSKPGE